MESALVSCIVPVFNGERYLRQAVESILAQTHRPIEIIVADDGSTDNTANVVGSYGDRVRYLKQDNRGPAAARNLGICAAKGEFIAFLDADDLWHAEKLARQLGRFLADPRLELCVTYCQNFWVPELAKEGEKYRSHRIAQPLPGYVTATLLARRSVFDKVGLFDVNLGHGDSTEWFLRATNKGTAMYMLHDVLTYRRLHESNRSRLLASNSREEFLHLLKSHLDQRRQVNKSTR